MGAEQSGLQRQRQGLHPGLADAILTRALLEALSDMSVEDSGRLQTMKEHAWDPEDCSPPFVVLRDGLTARRRPSLLTSDCIRGKKAYIQGRHVWEIQWEKDERGTFAIVGIATPKAPLGAIGYEPVIGTNTESWGWDLVSKKLYHAGERGVYPQAMAAYGFQVPDTFFVILDMNQSTLSFAANDIHLGVAFTQLPKQLDRPLCPIVNAIFGNCDIRMKYMGDGESILSRLKHPFSPNRPLTQPHSAPAEDNRRRSTGLPNLIPESSSVVPASLRYKFSYTRGENASVMRAGKNAKRVNALNSFCDAIVMTSEPLVDNELFEVRLDSKVSRWVGGLCIGATPKDSNSFAFPRSLPEFNKDVFMWCNNKIVYNAMERDVRENIMEMTTGDRVGVMRKSDDTLHFFKNGKDIGNCFGKTPKRLYAVVDIFGQAEEITITGGAAETQSSNDVLDKKTPDTVFTMVQMKNAIDLIRAPINPGLRLILSKLNENVLQPSTEATDRATAQKYGDHLVDIGAAQELKKLLARLDDTGIETEEGWVGMYIVRNILWNYADSSLKMAKEIGKCGLLNRFANDLKRAGPAQIRNERKAFIVRSALSILHNCSKATENRQTFRNIRAVEILVPFLKAEDSETVVTALLVLSYITDDNQKGLLETDTKTISVLRGMLSLAANNSNLRGTALGSTWSAFEIVTGIANIAVNQSNCEMLIDADVIPLLFIVIEKGGAIEKESAANALWVISNSENGKRKIRGHPGAVDILKNLSKHSNKNIAVSAERVLLRITQPLQQGIRLSSAPRKNCEYMQSCRVFLASLKLSDAYFDKSHDKCYCTKCHASRNEKLYYTQGDPAKDYALPTGWTRFALRITPPAKAHEAPKKWHVAYHGTSSPNVKSILECGQLLIPGDTALGGKRLSEVDGHFHDDRKPEGFNTKQVFVSPSIRYSELEVYAKTQTFVHPDTKKTYKAKVAFQLWIRPESYNVGPQTVGSEEEIDPKFSNQEIEWSTAERGAVHLYGLLVRLNE